MRVTVVSVAGRSLTDRQPTPLRRDFFAQLRLARFAFGEQPRESFLVAFSLGGFRFSSRQFCLARLQLTDERARFFPPSGEFGFQRAPVGRARPWREDQHQRHERAQQRPGAGQGEEI